MEADAEMMHGYQVDLDETRHVWVGKLGDQFMIEFKNKEGELTRLRLSNEAGNALGQLLRNDIPAPSETLFRIMAIVNKEPQPERTCQKCGCPTNGEEADVDGQYWCHPCADQHNHVMVDSLHKEG